MAYLAGLLSGLTIAAFIVIFAVLTDNVSIRQPRIVEKARKWETYGHPWPPVPELRRALPKAPMNTVWEVVAKYDENGEAYLWLNLLDMNANTISFAKANLTYKERQYNKTWAAKYRGWSSSDTVRRIFDDELIGPMVDKARLMANHYANAGTAGDYTTTIGGEGNS